MGKALLKLLPCAVALWYLPFGTAAAVEVTHTDYGSAVAACQGALPAYEGALRKRPLAMQNEGNAPAFISCAFPVENVLWRFEVALRSFDATAPTVSCTAVNGYDGGTPLYATKSSVLPASGETVILSWVPGDFGASGNFPIVQVSLSCALPKGASIGRTWTDSTRYIGN